MEICGCDVKTLLTKRKCWPSSGLKRAYESNKEFSEKIRATEDNIFGSGIVGATIRNMNFSEKIKRTEDALINTVNKNK